MSQRDNSYCDGLIKKYEIPVRQQCSYVSFVLNRGFYYTYYFHILYHTPNSDKTLPNKPSFQFRLAGVKITRRRPHCGFISPTCRPLTLQWRHNEPYGVSYHRRLDCLFSRLFRRGSKKTSKLRVTGLCEEICRWPVDFPHKGLITRKMFHLMTSSRMPMMTVKFTKKKARWLKTYCRQDFLDCLACCPSPRS